MREMWTVWLKRCVEPIVLSFRWATVWWAILFVSVIVWLEWIVPIADASYCFMDAVIWTDALEGFYYQVSDQEFIWDRPPLSIWAGSWFRHFGYTPPQALQWCARGGLAMMVASMGVGLLRRTSVLVTGLMLWTLLGMSTFTKLVIWLNAEMLVNGLFVMHLFAGWRAMETPAGRLRNGWLCTTGMLLGLAICAKEQGLLLAPFAVVMVTLLSSSWRHRIRDLGWYLAGTLPFAVWYGYWLRGQLVYGEKWRIFQSDLDILASQTSWSDMNTVSTTWGSFSRTFGTSDSVWTFFWTSSQSLLQAMWMPLGLMFIGILLSAGLVWRSDTRRLELSQWCWVLSHLLAVVPLLVVPIFEPYHYTVLWGPAVVGLGWSMHRLIRIHWAWVALLVLWGWWYQPKVRSLDAGVNLEVAECIGGRIRGIRNWARNGLPDDAIIYVTSSLVNRDQSLYPQRVYPFSKRLENCSSREYVMSSDISNERGLFLVERAQSPQTWQPIHQMVGVNQEVWEVYHCKD